MNDWTAVLDPITGDDHEPPRGSFVKGLIEERKSPYTALEDRIYKRVMETLKFPNTTQTFQSYLDSLEKNQANSVKTAIRAQIEDRIVRAIREDANYPACPLTLGNDVAGDDVNEALVGANYSLNNSVAHTEGVMKINAIAAEEITAFRARTVGKTA